MRQKADDPRLSEASTRPVTTWGLGEYQLMAQRLQPAAERAAAVANITAADTVLDVACGTGNGALAAARRGARAVGVDFEPAVLALAGFASRAEGLPVEWSLGDAAELPVSSSAFTVVLSLFGVMYAPDHAAALGELARAAAPGAQIVLTAWTPDSFMPALARTLAPYLPPPPAHSDPPPQMGDEARLPNLLTAAQLTLVETVHERLALSFAGPQAAVQFLTITAGHVMQELPRLRANGQWPPLLGDVTTLVEERARRQETDITIELDYLLATCWR